MQLMTVRRRRQRTGSSAVPFAHKSLLSLDNISTNPESHNYLLGCIDNHHLDAI